MQITLDETRARTQIEIDTRDKELEELRNIIKKNKKLNIPVVIASAAALGFGVGFGQILCCSLQKLYLSTQHSLVQAGNLLASTTVFLYR
jgi:soluble P-type ATPase